MTLAGTQPGALLGAAARPGWAAWRGVTPAYSVGIQAEALLGDPIG